MKYVLSYVRISRRCRSFFMAGTALVPAALFSATPARAYDFEMGNMGALGDVHASWVTQATLGFGLRAEDPSCSLIGAPNTGGCGTNVNAAQWGNGSNGNANYKAGQFYTAYVKGTTELLLTSTEGYKFLGRGTGVVDFAADQTQTTGISNYGNDQSVRNATLLDFWVSKDFDLGEQRAHVRAGNQVINWGESLFASGGINATNALDIQKLLVPGTQLKEALLPAPMISFATGILPGLSFEGYYQFMWNGDRVPPVGTYFSTANIFDKGRTAIYLNGSNTNLNSYANDPNAIAVPVQSDDGHPSNLGQWGVNLHWKPEGTKMDLGLYYLRYHDKLPVLVDYASGNVGFRYLPTRTLYGASANFPIGDLSIGAELSYRPHDAVELTGCFNAGGLSDVQNNGFTGAQCNQWKDQNRYQSDLTMQLNQSPSDYRMLDWLLRGADTAYLTFEYTDIYIPGVSSGKQYNSVINGTKVYQMVQANYNTWLQSGGAAGTILAGKGTEHSGGITLDYNWTYDGTVIPGWQLTPGATFSWSVYGYTPDINANYMMGAKNINFYTLFNQNPAVWQAGLNFTHYWGGTALTQPFGDRDFVGGFVTRNF